MELFFGTDPNSPDNESMVRFSRNKKSLSLIFHVAKLYLSGFTVLSGQRILKIGLIVVYLSKF